VVAAPPAAGRFQRPVPDEGVNISTADLEEFFSIDNDTHKIRQELSLNWKNEENTVPKREFYEWMRWTGEF
jgi:hypothetical protein